MIIEDILIGVFKTVVGGVVLVILISSAKFVFDLLCMVGIIKSLIAVVLLIPSYFIGNFLYDL